MARSDVQPTACNLAPAIFKIGGRNLPDRRLFVLQAGGRKVRQRMPTTLVGCKKGKELSVFAL
jgi:hypothetical protein